MGLSGQYGLPAPDEERVDFLDEAYGMGEILGHIHHLPIEIDATADIYGDCEYLLGKWFAANLGKRDNIFLSTNFGICPEGRTIKVDSSPEYCREAIESLKRLGLPFANIFHVHHLDKVTLIEKMMVAMVELKYAGKIQYIGLSECSADTLRRASAIHPITCV
ncbi:NADP-dependent oxidoreductase domain-containing protein [Trichoderma ceciliae]